MDGGNGAAPSAGDGGGRPRRKKLGKKERLKLKRQQALGAAGDRPAAVAGGPAVTAADSRRKGSKGSKGSKKRRSKHSDVTNGSSEAGQAASKRRRRVGAGSAAKDSTGAGSGSSASGAATARRPAQAPEVVEFVAPGAQRAAIREEIRAKLKRRGGEEGEEGEEGDGSRASGGKRGGRRGDSEPSFFDMYREVQEFGVAGLDVRSQKEYEARKVAQLGGDSKHTIKMPLPMLLGVRKARAKREEKQRELERVSGVITGKRREKKGSKYHDRRRKMLSHRKGTAGVSDLQGGTMRNGILFVKDT